MRKSPAGGGGQTLQSVGHSGFIHLNEKQEQIDGVFLKANLTGGKNIPWDK